MLYELAFFCVLITSMTWSGCGGGSSMGNGGGSDASRHVQFDGGGHLYFWLGQFGPLLEAHTCRAVTLSILDGAAGGRLTRKRNADAEHAEVGGWLGQFGIPFLRSPSSVALCIMLWKNRKTISQLYKRSLFNELRSSFLELFARAVCTNNRH